MDEKSLDEKLKFLPNLIDPIDFHLDPSDLSSLSCPNVQNDFKFIISEQTYLTNKNLARTVFRTIDSELNSNQDLDSYSINLEDPKFYFQNIQTLLIGKTITVNENNANFLFNVAKILDCPKLLEVTLPFQLRYLDNEFLPPTGLQKTFSILYSFFCKFSILTRIVFFLCELIGYAVAFGFCFNLVMMPISAGIISPNIPEVYRWILMIPFFLFQFNILNLLSLFTYYLCKFNFLFSESFLPKHVHLIKMIAIVWPFCNKEKVQNFDDLSINLSLICNSNSLDSIDNQPPKTEKKEEKQKSSYNIYNFILGVFFIVLLFLMLNHIIFRFVMLSLTIYIPVILIAGIIIFYSFHAFLSIFSTAREKYIANGDLSDPFLCSMYFYENPWNTLFSRLTKNRFNSSSDPNINDSKFKLFVDAFFSRSTFGIYLIIMLSIMMITERKSFSNIQIVSIIVLFFIILIPLLSSIRFGFFLVIRLFSSPVSENQLKEMRGWIHSKNQRVQWLSKTLTWSKSTISIRLTRLCFIIFFMILLFVSIFFISQSRHDASVSISNNTNFQQQKYYDNKTHFLITNPICSVNIANLSITEYGALAIAAYSSNTSSTEYKQLISEFFPNASDVKLVEDVITNPYTGSLKRFQVKRQDGTLLNIISVRGTSNSYDMMADVELWAASFVMNVLQVSIPLMSAYATDSREFLGYTMHLPRFLFGNFSLINSYIKMINNNVKKEKGYETIIVGHSLGGGLAKLASVMSGYQAVSFSGPGIQALSSYYKFIDPNLDDTFVNIIPQLDPVAAVDQTSGSAFLIPCNAGLLACHSIKRTVCMLSTLCGDFEKHYNFCVAEFGKNGMEEMKKIGKPYAYDL